MPKSRILVIDDEAAIRDSLKMTLEYEGYEFLSAATGQEGLALIERESPDLVLLDVKMPGMDGLDVLGRLHTMSETLPVVMISAHGTPSTAVDAIRRGALDFLEKPFEDDRLIGMIDVALKQAESGARSEAAVLDIAARIESLSPRERQVMEGLVAGLSNKIIAREYDISPRTIEVYRANVMTKMLAGSLSELVRLAMRAGAIKD